jgi:pimeloyl-ACP methyl ester carboxylesterase
MMTCRRPTCFRNMRPKSQPLNGGWDTRGLGAMHAGFSQFATFDQDAIDNIAFVTQGKLTMPVLAVGGEKSFGPTTAVVMRAAATDVQEQVILASCHWLMEEQPRATIAAMRAFLDRQH